MFKYLNTQKIIIMLNYNSIINTTENILTNKIVNILNEKYTFYIACSINNIGFNLVIT